jgi:hypothetical protein
LIANNKGIIRDIHHGGQPRASAQISGRILLPLQSPIFGTANV